MFKVEIIDFFGPFCGHGGYGRTVRIGMDRRSPKKAYERARKAKPVGDQGGGVPILGDVRFWRGTTPIPSRAWCN